MFKVESRMWLAEVSRREHWREEVKDVEMESRCVK